MADYMDFGFGSGDDDIGKKIKKFVGKEGENYRLSFVWWPTVGGKLDLSAPSPRFVGVKRHYIQGVGYVLSKGPAWDQLAGGAPKTAIATIVAVWPTDKKGNLDKSRFTNGDVETVPWIFSGDKYDQLKRRHDEFPLGSHDLAIACTESQYQKMDISPCRESLFRKCVESDNDKLIEIARNIQSAVTSIEANIRNELARDLTLDQIREKLGGSPNGSAGGSPSGVSAADVDNLLDNLID